MMDDETKAAMAYLNEAQPETTGHTYDAARSWLHSNEREARGLRAALKAIGIMGDHDTAIHGDGPGAAD